jgi:DNA repair exonuclease SbcCD ATPase subunit
LDLSLGTGINVLYGPNEIGKSTLIEAIQEALLGDAFSSRQSYKDLVPWNTSVKAHVSLTIKNRDGKRYTIEKSFPKGEASLTYLGKADTEDSSPRTAQRIAEGKQVNTVILQKLGLEHDSSSLIKLLWIKQGEALSLFSNMGTRKGQGLVEEPLIRRIREAIREQLSSPIADELIKRLQEDRDSYIKADGKYKSARNSMGKEILDLKSELNETKQSIRSCENEMEEFRDKIGILQNITAEIDRAQEQLQKKQQYISQLKKKREACDSLKEITLTLDPLLEKEKHLHELMRQKKETAELLPAAYAKMKRLAGEELAAIE